MLVFAGSRCYKSQVTAAGPHPREPQGAILNRVPEGRRNGGEEEIIEEGDSQADHGQAQHGKEGRRGTLDEEEGGSQAGGGTGCPARCPEALDHLYRWAPRGPAGRTATEPALLRRVWQRARHGQRVRVRLGGRLGANQDRRAATGTDLARRRQPLEIRA